MGTRQEQSCDPRRHPGRWREHWPGTQRPGFRRPAQSLLAVTSDWCLPFSGVSRTNTSELTQRHSTCTPSSGHIFPKPHLMCKCLPPSVFKFLFCKMGIDTAIWWDCWENSMIAQKGIGATCQGHLREEGKGRMIPKETSTERGEGATSSRAQSSISCIEEPVFI